MAKKNQDRRCQFIGYRPGALLASWIADWAANWKLSDHEAAKRLAALAATHHGLDDYPHLLTWANATADLEGGGGDFTVACAQARAVVNGANMARASAGQPLLTHDERQEYLRRAAEEAAAASQLRQASNQGQ